MIAQPKEKTLQQMLLEYKAEHEQWSVDQYWKQVKAEIASHTVAVPDKSSSKIRISGLTYESDKIK